ncbi:MAG TPA: pyridoxal-dependent decarboxylase [Holophagaceae bacterium]|nr:pyridoxal-dependent decarboxylase [Holophagaceae bacterium]
MDPRAVFLGPQGQNADAQERMFLDAIRDHVHWRRSFHPGDPDAVDPVVQLDRDFLMTQARTEAALRRLLARLKGSAPVHSPRYLGHMVGDTLLPAQVGYLAAMLYNPNNVAQEASPVTSELEVEVGRDLCELLGFDPETGFAHLCSGGTVANLEALWAYRNLARRGGAAFGRLGMDALLAGTPGEGPEPDWAVLVPSTAHYSWAKSVDLLGMPPRALVKVAVDASLRMDPTDLAAKLEALAAEGRPVLACVAVVGTTEGGGLDPLPEILAVREAFRARHGATFFIHADAAYGGYARALVRNPEGGLLDLEGLRKLVPDATAAQLGALAALSEVDGATVDPHKLGYIPYPAGAIAFKDKRVRTAVASPAAYINQGNPEHPGTYALEGSRPGAAVAACWMAHRAVSLDAAGYGRILGESLRTSRGMAELLDGKTFGRATAHLLAPPDLDVILFAFTEGGPCTLDDLNALSAKVLAAFNPAGQGPFSFTSTVLRAATHGPGVKPFLAKLGADPAAWEGDAQLLVLRSTMMTPFVSDPELKAFYRGQLRAALAEVLA